MRARHAVLLAWLAALALLLPWARRAERSLEVAARVPGSESADVERLLVTRFSSPFAYYAVLVVSGLPAPDQPAGREALRRLTSALADAPGVRRTFSYLDAPDPLFLPAGGGTFVVVGLDPGEGTADALIPPLRSLTATLLPSLRRNFPDAALRWTGEAALNHDLRVTSTQQARNAEARVLPITLLLLLVAFGSLAAAGLPVLSGALTIPLALGVAGAIAQRWPLSILLVNVVSMIGLGLGIDYALLAVSRFREALAAGLAPAEAARETARHAGRTVALSGLAVAVGFAALLIVPLTELRSVAFGGLVVTLVSVLLVTTLLPVLLAWLGPRVNAGRLRRRRVPAARTDLLLRWGQWVARHPVRVLVLAGVPVLALALQSTRLVTGLPRGDWLPRAMESAQAVHELRAMGRSAVIQSVRVVVELPEGVTVWDERGWAATHALGQALAVEPLVARVRSLPELAAGAPPALVRARLPEDVRRTFASDDGRLVLLELLPREDAASEALGALVERVRSADAARLAALAGTRVRVGGLPAFNLDYDDAVAGRFAWVVALVLTGTLLVLGVGFRSLLVPLKAVALNLLSVAAAFGALVLAFQDGALAGLFGLEAGTGAVFPSVPILVFCTVFGLSMDYEVFLVARVAEARRRGLDDAAALAEGLARTGGIITGAAAIMIVVFGAFTLGDFLLVQMLGFALAVAVFLDATVVRLALGPALLRLAGRWNWWPGGVSSGAALAERPLNLPLFPRGHHDPAYPHPPRRGAARGGCSPAACGRRPVATSDGRPRVQCGPGDPEAELR